MEEVSYEELRATAELDVNGMEVSETEWNIRINQATKDYWNRLNLANQLYNATKESFFFQAGVAEYALPDNFLFCIAADIDKNGSEDENSQNRISVEFLPLEYRNARRSQTNYVSSGNYPGPYTAIIMSSTTLTIQPTPTNSSYLFILRYVPVTPKLVNSTDTINGINGFADYISQVAAKRILDSRGVPSTSLDVSILQFQKFLESCAVVRNRANRTPLVDRGIGPYASFRGS